MYEFCVVQIKLREVGVPYDWLEDCARTVNRVVVPKKLLFFRAD